MNLFVKKPLSDMLNEADEEGQNALKRHLNGTSLIMLGVGATIGAGIFLLTARAIAMNAGPGVTLSFVVAGLGCAFAGLCYAEFASMVPVSGSAYTYSYGTMGQLVAWIIGWDLVLEYALGAATVSIGWSEYLNEFIKKFIGEAWMIPQAWCHSPFDLAQPGIMNVPALVVLLLMTMLLIRGIRESALVNGIIVFVKVTIVLLFIGLGWQFMQAENHHIQAGAKILLKTSTGVESRDFGGWGGMWSAAGIVFFAFLGFDAVSTAARETKNPKRNVPIGILGSLVICTTLYILFSYVLTGIAPYTALQQKVPGTEIVTGVISPALPIIIDQYMQGYAWLSGFITVAVLFGFTSVILVNLMAQSRVFISMSRDGLIPKVFSDIHPRFSTPAKSNLILFVFTGIFAAFVPRDTVGEMTSIGTLFAFILVCVGILVMRRSNPDTPRPFKTPLVPLVPILGILFCGAMMLNLGIDNWIRLLVWLLIGLVIYFGYSRRYAKIKS
ncbi:amino acid permease [Haliscomenobacter hydrossis]|uniref:Amino acid permease-associated region n=1 Tax=Haliscomenobacter hydrossis (strain ATCC 27775 / DSM 1100 / LMG 10767 / O) TaxID=760192 RepID=F4L2P2_HALH1|nr:amino acid permease [Haliscomenobacter hydrossis]AEE48606.1 amino acid permease-associated region [Haliscomenobacter hydrossis DSM 1100]